MTESNALEGVVPRPKTDTTQVTFRVPSEWLEQADAIATLLGAARRVPSSRTDVFREAIARGFEALTAEAGRREETQYRISAYDGMASTCLFWFGSDIDVAKRRADELARTHIGSKWSVFRVYRGDEEQPVHRAPVKRKG